MKFLLLLLLCLAACQTTKPEQVKAEPYLSGADLEDRKLPPDPTTEDLPSGMSAQERLDPIELGDKAPYAGILMSEARATRDGFFRIRYRELRQDYEADRKLMSAERKLYERQIELDRQRIVDLTPPPPNWWDLHGTTLVVVGAVTIGVISGAALTVGIGYSLYGAGTSP